MKVVLGGGRTFALATALVFAANACGIQRLVRDVVPPEQLTGLDRRSDYLKAHTHDGRLYVLSKWSVDETSKVVQGEGELLDANRTVVERGVLSVPVAAVALFETNVVQKSPSVSALSVVTGVSVAVTVACLANPKACFGSCPTFYVAASERPLLQAEGFSDSVAPSLEASDVDALFRARPTHRDLDVRMTNEALETHVVRHVHLLATPRSPGRRVFQTASGEFCEGEEPWEPQSCTAADGDCIEALRRFDGKERFSETDPRDLATREIVALTFPQGTEGRLGLIVGARQTLLSTYLLYQTLAYMGRSSSAWLATLERGQRAFLSRAHGMQDALGKIEVLVQNGTRWIPAGEVGETGPLASDVKVVPLPTRHSGPLTVRLRLTRGHWRLDFVAATRLGARVEPLRLEPTAMRWEPGPYSLDRNPALPSGGLVTLPGDAATFSYRLPADFKSYELFLESRGYYLEWMRNEWLPEEDPSRVVSIFRDPRRALRELAPEFKKQEARMETLFWRSRYAP